MASKKCVLNPTYAAAFSRFVKKQSTVFQAVLEDVINDEILPDPLVGTQKAGNLSDYWVHKFKHLRQQYLIAYRFPEYQGKADDLRKLINSKELVTLEIEVLNIEFSQLGSHENFYTDLSKKK